MTLSSPQRIHKVQEMLASVELDAVKILTLGRTRKVIPPPWYKGEGLIEPHHPHWVFDMFQYFKRILPSVERAFDVLYKVVVLLEVCDITKHGRYLGFYQELERT